MSNKNKYGSDSGNKTETGERKHRDHTKSGKKAARKEQRRLDAMARQVKRIQGLEGRLEKVKNKKDHLRKIARAQVVLQCIRGGKPHDQLWAEFKSPPKPVTEPKA